MAEHFRLAVGQSPGELATPRARLDWLAATLADLRRENVDLLALPEMFLSGYHIGDAVIERAEAADGPCAQKIAALAARFGIAVLYGFAERADGVLYSAAQCFGPDGARLGSHRKLAIPPGFETDYYTAGAGCRLFDLGGLKIAILVCYDCEFTEPMRHVAGLGAELVVVPTALSAQWDWVARTMVPTRAYENGQFVAYANHAGSENGLDYLGASFIAAPDGMELARAGAAPEVLIADLDRERVARARARLPYLKDRAGLKLDAV
jgi:predicted amidohydrolase